LIGSLPREAQQPAFESGQVLEPETSPGRHILVIDDEEAVLDIVRRFLEIAGHQVVCASSGHDGLDWLSKSKEIELVVLDLMMPREDAAITFQRIRQRRPDLPVLLCTGMPQTHPAPDLLKNEGVSLIRKPFRMNELWYAVRKAVGAVGVPPLGGESA
jgi:DNA-binding NtrC family response regulator